MNGASAPMVRRFGLLHATALNMTNMIGIGPFITIPLLVALALIRFVVVPLEEAHLLARFGDAYRTYSRRTGRLLPQLRRRNEAP